MSESLSSLKDDLLLYVVSNSDHLPHNLSLLEVVEQALLGGATMVQVREKNASTAELVTIATPILELCRAHGVPCIINDDIDACIALGADGVHVGQEDVEAREARRRIGPDKILGVSAQTVEQALAAYEAGADYLGVGTMVFTSTKPDAVVVSVEELSKICRAVPLPCVAIGGMNESTLGMLKETGVAGAAVVSAVFSAADPKKATEQLVAQVKDVIS